MGGDSRLPKPGRIKRPLRLRGHVRPIKRVGQTYRTTVATQPIAAKERELKQGVQSQAKPPPGTSLVVGMHVRDRMGFKESAEEVDDGAVCPRAGDARAVVQFDHDDAETLEGGCRAVLEDAVLAPSMSICRARSSEPGQWASIQSASRMVDESLVVPRCFLVKWNNG